jgi:hypothetical protein
MVARKKRDRQEGAGQDTQFKGIFPVTYFL